MAVFSTLSISAQHKPHLKVNESVFLFFAFWNKLNTAFIGMHNDKKKSLNLMCILCFDRESCLEQFCLV